MSSPHSFKVDLRLRHPIMDFGHVAQLLGMTAKHVYRAGEPRRTPNGGALPGVYPISWWCSDPFGQPSWRPAGGYDVPLGPKMGEVVMALLLLLAPHADFLRQVAAQGKVEIWVSSHGKGNYALVLAPECVMRLAALGITLVHDVYGVPQH